MIIQMMMSIISSNIINYTPYRAFRGQNKIAYFTRFETRTAIVLLLPGR